jgi:hypothetical protein
MPTVTCRTDGCGNAGYPIELDFGDLPPEDMPTSFWCGVCGQEIKDIQE